MLFARVVSTCVATTSPSCQVNRPSSAVLSMDHRGCDSQATPRSPVHPYRLIGDPEPTWHSSRNRGGEPVIVPGHRVQVPKVALRSCRPPMLVHRARLVGEGSWYSHHR